MTHPDVGPEGSRLRSVPPDDIQGLYESCVSGHIIFLGVCRICGAWLPAAVCRQPGCGWRSEAGELSLRLAVKHRLEHEHPVRVEVG